jgi:hypothetical protein
MSWFFLLRKGEGAVTTTLPSAKEGKLFNISHGGKKHGKDEEE